MTDFYRVTLEQYEEEVITGSAMNSGQSDLQAAIRFALIGFQPYFGASIEEFLAMLIVEHQTWGDYGEDFSELAKSASAFLDKRKGDIS